MSRAIALHLHRRNHVHVVNPVTRLARNAVRRGLFPLFVGQAFAQIEILLLFCLHINLERHDPKDAVIHMRLGRDLSGSIRQEWVEFLDESRLEVPIIR